MPVCASIQHISILFVREFSFIGHECVQAQAGFTMASALRTIVSAKWVITAGVVHLCL